MRYSKIIATFDHDAISREHEFWHLRMADDDKLRPYSPLFADLARIERIEGVSYSDGTQAYVMMEPSPMNLSEFASVRDKACKSLCAERVSSRAVPENELVNLLMAGLAKSKYDRDPMGNLAGRTVVLLPPKRGDGSDCRVSIDVHCTPDMELTLSVRTFTRLTQARYMVRGFKVPLEKLPRYEINESGFMRPVRNGAGDKKSYYVPRVANSSYLKRHVVPLIDLSDADKFMRTKLGVLCEVMQRLNVRYGGAVSLSFAEIPYDENFVVPGQRKAGPWRDEVKNAFDGTGIVVRDATGTHAREGRALVRAIGRMFRDAPVRFSNKRDEGQDTLFASVPCIVIVDDKQTYEAAAVDDPYGERAPSAVEQHITTSSLSEVLSKSAKQDERDRNDKMKADGKGDEYEPGDPHSNPILESTVKELAIKMGVSYDALTLGRKSVEGLSGTWTFAMLYDRFIEKVVPEGLDGKEPKRLRKVHVDEDGNLVEGEREPDENEAHMNVETRVAFVDVDCDTGRLSFEEMSKTALIYTSNRHELGSCLLGDESLEYAIMGPSGDVNLVSRTDLFTLPDYESLEALLSAGCTSVRKNEDVERYLADVCGVAYCPVDDHEGYYRVGDATKGMGQSLKRAAVLRHVRAEGGNAMLFPDVLAFLDVDFVRLKLLTVKPFPLKYLSEWLRSKGLVLV